MVGKTFTLRDTASALLLADGLNAGFVPAHPVRCNGICLLVLFFALADCLGLSLGRCVSDFSLLANFLWLDQVALIGSKIEWEHGGDGVDNGQSRLGSSSLTELECSLTT